MLHQTPLKLCLLSKLSIFNLAARGYKKESMVKGVGGGGGGNYLGEAIILNISVKGEQLFMGGNLSRDSYYSRKYGTLGNSITG